MKIILDDGQNEGLPTTLKSSTCPPFCNQLVQARPNVPFRPHWWPWTTTIVRGPRSHERSETLAVLRWKQWDAVAVKQRVANHFDPNTQSMSGCSNRSFGLDMIFTGWTWVLTKCNPLDTQGDRQNTLIKFFLLLDLKFDWDHCDLWQLHKKNC